MCLLQQRQKWISPKRNCKVGDIVLLKDENLPRNNWRMGRVVKVHQDNKGAVRNVSVKTQSTLLERPVQKLVLLLESELD